MIAHSSPENSDSHDVAALCACQLRAEAIALAAVLPLLRAAREAFGQRDFQSFVGALAGQQQSLKLMEEINLKRQSFRAALARHLGIEPQQTTWAGALSRLPRPIEAEVADQLANVRRLADELAATSFALSIQLRIYLDAYRRLLRDVTNTAASSGRYGSAGMAESHEYRSLIQIHG
jgi:hypothetical protein